MKLRLPLMLLAAVLATFPAAYGSTIVDWNTGNRNLDDLLSDAGILAYNYMGTPRAFTPLLPQGNSADGSYGLSSSLVMTNTAAETIANLSMDGLTGATILTLGSGGLTVTDTLSLIGDKAANIVGGSLSVGEIAVTGRGVLTVVSDLKVDGKRTTTISGDSKTMVNLGKVVMNDGTLVLSSKGSVDMATLNVGTNGGTLTWNEGNKLDISQKLNFTQAGATLILNAGEGGLVFNSIVLGIGSTLNLASGKLIMVQGQTQNFKVDAGAELTFDVTGAKLTASGTFSGKGKVILKNSTSGNLTLTDGSKFGGDWTNFGGHMVLDSGVAKMRQSIESVVGASLPSGERATVEVKNGAQFYDTADGGVSAKRERTCNWILNYGTWESEGMGSLRVQSGATYSGSILSNGGWIGGASDSPITVFSGDISGSKLMLGSDGWNGGWSISAQLSGDNSGLSELEILRGVVIADSLNALGKNVKLLKGVNGNDKISRVNIVQDVQVETLQGVVGSVMDIAEAKSLTLNGQGTGAFAGTLSGKGSLKLQGSAGMVLSGNNSSYEGSVVVDGNSVLTVAGTTSVTGLSGTGTLLIKGAGALTVKGMTGGDHSLGGVSFSSGGTLTLQTAAAGALVLGEMSLLDGVNSLVVDGAAGALNVNMGTISGSGVLIVSGLDSFAGTLGEGASLNGILFRGNDGLYEAVSLDGNIGKGSVRVDSLQASGNVAGKTYMLSGDLTMTNTAGESVARILAQGLQADSTLTLGSGGLVVSDVLLFNGDGKNLTVTGSTLSAGAITATGIGTLAINSELVIDGKKTMAVKNSAGTTLTLGNVSLNDGTLTLSGTVGVSALKVGAAGGTVSWLDGSTSDISTGLTFTNSGATLVLNAGNGGLVLNSVVAGTGSILNLASGKMVLSLGQTQNFMVDTGAELTFNAASNVKVAAGSFTGKGIVVVKNTGGSSLQLDAGFGGNLANYGGHFLLDGNGQQMRVAMNTLVGSSLTNGEKAVVEIKNGAQYYDDAAVGERTNDWVLSGVGFKPATTEEGMGALRASPRGSTYSGNITIASGGARIGAAADGNLNIFKGKISGDTLQLGTNGSRDSWFLKAELSGDNSGLKGIEVLRADLTASSATALGKNLNLTIGTGANLSKVNIVADVVLETLKGVTGSVLNISENKSLSLTGTGTSSFAGNLLGKGGLKLQDSVQVTLTGSSTSYEGIITIGERASLIVGGGNTVVSGLSGTGNVSLSGGGNLTMKGLNSSSHFQGELKFSSGGKLTLQTAAAASQIFDGVSLIDGINSLEVNAAAGALTLNLGSIRGSGMLVVSGLDSFSGTFGAGASADGIFFQKNGGLYESVVTGGSIGIGSSQVGALLATGNEAGKTYTLSGDLTMTNTAGESVRRVLAQGFTANATLALGAGGLTVTDAFAFNGGGKNLTINGATLRAGSITATGGGTLAINSELVVDGKRTTAISNATGNTLTLAKVTLNDGTLTFSGTVGVTAVTVGASGGTISWLNGSVSDISGGLTFAGTGATLSLNTGSSGITFNTVFAGTGSTVKLASGKLSLVQGQTQNFAVDAGAELTFNVKEQKVTAGGSRGR